MGKAIIYKISDNGSVERYEVNLDCFSWKGAPKAIKDECGIIRGVKVSDAQITIIGKVISECILNPTEKNGCGDFINPLKTWI